MTVIKKPKLEKYFDTLLDQYIELIDSSNGEGEKSHEFMKNLLENEKKFLYNSTDDPCLSIDLNGLPSLETFTQDIIAMKEWEEFSDKNLNYVESIEDKINKNQPYTKTTKEEFNEKIKSQNQDILKKTSYNLTNNDSNLTLNILEEHFIDGFDGYSLNTPIAYKLTSTDYQVIWNNLVSKTTTEYNIVKSEQKNKTIENKLAVTEENKNIMMSETKQNLSAIASMANQTKNFGIDSVKFGVSSIEYLLFYPTFRRKTIDKKKQKGKKPDMSNFHSSKYIISLFGIAIPLAINPPLILPYALSYLGLNAASGIYEWHRHEKNKVKQKQLEEK